MAGADDTAARVKTRRARVAAIKKAKEARMSKRQEDKASLQKNAAEEAVVKKNTVDDLVASLLPPETPTNVEAGQGNSSEKSGVPVALDSAASRAARLARLGLSGILNEVSINPVVHEYYVKEVQTEVSSFDVGSDGPEDDSKSVSTNSESGGDAAAVSEAGEPEENGESDECLEKTETSLSPEEAEAFLTDSLISKRLLSSLGVMERAVHISEQVDYAVDYSTSAAGEDIREEANGDLKLTHVFGCSSVVESVTRLAAIASTNDTPAVSVGSMSPAHAATAVAVATKGVVGVRDVTFHPLHPELVLVAVDVDPSFPPLMAALGSSAASGGSSGPTAGPAGSSATQYGAVIAYALPTTEKGLGGGQGRPEYVLLAHGVVKKVLVSQFDRMVYGGLESGVLVKWAPIASSGSAMSSPGDFPKERSGVSVASHTDSLSSLALVGTKHAHNLISVSIDGRVCGWSPATLGAVGGPPVGLSFPLQWMSGDVAPQAVEFFKADTNTFVVGSWSGALFLGNRLSSSSGAGRGSSSNKISISFKYHTCMISDVATHPQNSVAAFAPLFAAVSLDSSLSVWSRNQSAVTTSTGASGNTTEVSSPLVTVDLPGSYPQAVAWSPTCSSVCAVVGDMGLVVFDLSSPGAGSHLEPALRAGSPSPSSLFTALKWSSDGARVVVGDVDGGVYVFSMPSRLVEPLTGDRLSSWSALVDTRAA